MKPIKVISLGGGLQSTTLLLLSLHGVIEKCDVALFADTGWERQATYKNVEMLTEYAKSFDVPIVTVKGYASVREQMLTGQPDGFIHAPIFQESIDGKQKQQLKRQCTTHFKLKPIRQYMRKTYGNRATFEQWIGISLDESTRMKPSGVQYIKNRYPLVDMRWGRGNCVEWLNKNGFSIPSKSACVGCPLHSNEVWLMLNEDERQDAIEVDEQIRDTYKGSTKILRPKQTKEGQGELFDIKEADGINDNTELMVQEKDMRIYLNQNHRPLKDFFDNPALQLEFSMDLENEECEGMCFL